jgi:hypothetical protein
MANESLSQLSDALGIATARLSGDPQRMQMALGMQQSRKLQQQENKLNDWIGENIPEDQQQLLYAVPFAERAKILMGSQKERRIIKGADDFQRYVDTGKKVFPDVSKKPDVKDSFGNEDKLRDDYIKSSNEFIDVRNSFDRILSVTNKEPTAAGDLSLIFNYMKMLDPGSTVREGEFATAKNSAGVDDRLRALYNGMVEGERLAPNTRADFVNQAFNLYEGQQSIQEMNMDYWKNLAKEYDFKESRIVQNYGAPLTPKIFKSKIRFMSDIDLANLDFNALTKEQEEVVKKELERRN